MGELFEWNIYFNGRLIEWKSLGTCKTGSFIRNERFI